MSSFPFEFIVNYKMEIWPITPPSNYSIFLQSICEKYDLNVASIYYQDDDGLEVQVRDESDYVDLINYMTDSKLEEIEIVVRSSEDMSKKRKKNLRKRSSMTKNDEEVKEKIKTTKGNVDKVSSTGEGGGEDDLALNDMMCDYDYYGDTRNTRSGIEDGEWTNHGKGYKNMKRIYYIKEKKQMQRDEQRKEEEENNEDMDVDDDEEEEKKNCHKRKIKNKKKDDEDENMEVEEVKIKYGKKPKKPKKDRTHW